MANIKSAIKRIRVINKQTAVNRSRKSKYRNAIKKMNSLLISKNKKEALAFLPKLNSELMRVAKTGIIKRNNASRNISRITKKINAL
tara:strand:+ start:483 stop:743 length:261 start_codon:yes stop_codon:yes gene_type:complete